ncbi:hypothetical protein NDU88_002601 [Pleurodeles waltl]|uniref:Uncharacterized protein n=1 Tax=Pleurodeles waltl TaxID=8319 RepID=A0AAV7WQE9_PLEWA|nr:hypothetical protein NDU88_002601 [Pleurodeles waltl]
MVHVKDRHQGSKFSLLFEPTPWKITRVQGTMVTIMRDTETVTRNVAFFKCYKHESVLVEKNSPLLNDEDDVAPDVESRQGAAQSTTYLAENLMASAGTLELRHDSLTPAEHELDPAGTGFHPDRSHGDGAPEP